MIQEFFIKARINYLENSNNDYSKKIKNIQAEIDQITNISEQTLNAIQTGISHNSQYEEFAEKSKAHQQFYEFHMNSFSESKKINISNVFEERIDELEAKKRDLNDKLSANKLTIKQLLSDLENLE